MTIGLIGKKIGMTREFFESGNSVPVTVFHVEKGRIIDVITKEKRGYDAIKVGFGKIKTSKLSKQSPEGIGKDQHLNKSKFEEVTITIAIRDLITREHPCIKYPLKNASSNPACIGTSTKAIMPITNKSGTSPRNFRSEEPDIKLAVKEIPPNKKNIVNANEHLL